MPTPLFALVLLAPTFDAPRLLIAPLAPAKKGGPTPSSALGGQLANEFEEDGRTAPVVWGLTDPIFRSAALDGKLGDVPLLPTRAQALNVGRKLGAGYVLLYRSEYKDGSLNASAELVQDGRTIWKDAKNMGATLNNAQNNDDAAASIARTWVLLLSTGPLKGLPSKKAAATPPPTQGQTPIKADDPPPPPPPTTNVGDLEARLSALTKGGKHDAARALARDAVDADPLSPAPRMALVRLLAAQGDPDGAAEQARRAADLMPDQAELRIDAARRLLAIGKVREAHEQANELRARMPEDKAARRLSAEVALAEDDGETAIREIEPILKAGDDPQSLLLRGLARARLGGADGAAADLKAWSTATSDPVARAEGYGYARRMLGAMAERASEKMLPLLQRATAQPKSGAVRDELDEVQRQAQARTAAWAALTAPAGDQKQHDAWSLAHRLLTLATADLRAYLGGNEEALTAARIDLGEAKRAMKEARQVPVKA